MRSPGCTPGPARTAETSSGSSSSGASRNPPRVSDAVSRALACATSSASPPSWCLEPGGSASHAACRAPARTAPSAGSIGPASRGLQLQLQPRAGHRPVALHGRRRHAHRFRRLLHGEATEVAQLDDACLLGIQRASRVRATSSATRSTRAAARAAGPIARAMTCSSSVTRCPPPPRLAALRARARCTRIWRIDNAAMATKCARFWNWRVRSADSWRNASLTSAVAWSVWPRPLAADVARGNAPQLVVDERQQRGLGPGAFAHGARSESHLPDDRDAPLHLGRDALSRRDITLHGADDQLAGRRR